MAIRFLESFGWPVSGATGNPFLDRGYVVSHGQFTTSQTKQRPGSGGVFDFGTSGNYNDANVRFPIHVTPTCTLGFCWGKQVSGDPAWEGLNLVLNNSTNGVSLDIHPLYMSYTIGGFSGSVNWNIINSFVYIEVQVTPSLIILRVNNQEVARRAGSGFSAGNGFLTFYSPGSTSLRGLLGDVYLTDDAIFRGDCYVRLMELTATVDNTGVKEGPAATIHEGLKTFSGVDFVTYDESGEGTTLELQDIADNPSNIHGVMIRYSTAKTETDNVTAIPYVRVDSGAGYVQADLPSHQPGPNYAPVEHPLTLDPTDGGAWTKSKVNSLRVGLRRL